MTEAESNYYALINELNRIATMPYKEQDSQHNHQVFAAVLLWIMKSIRYNIQQKPDAPRR